MNDTLLIIVLYKTKIEDVHIFKTLNSTIDILIYDNSPQRQRVESKYYYYHDDTNPGVSAGYNYGIKLALELNKKFVIILDQDTRFDSITLEKYRKMKLKYGEDYIYAPIIIGNNKIYSPFLEKKNRNLYQKNSEFEYQEIYNLNSKSVINSGLMIPISIINDIGNFNEKIKLDFSDIYFIEKYKRKKSEIILINTEIEHSISGDEGKDKNKELSRFKYFCNGAREFQKASEYAPRIRRIILFRMLRLMIKYKSIKPILIVKAFYLGERTL